jgi:hypothetical protein
MNEQKPVLQAMLIADHVYQDKATGKRIIAGIFGRLLFTSKEDVAKELAQLGEGNKVLGGMVAGAPHVYLSMTDLNGVYPFTLRYVSLESDQVLFQMEFGIECNNPLDTVELSFGLPPLPSLKAGVFALELLWKDEPLGSVRVVVDELKI